MKSLLLAMVMFSLALPALADCDSVLQGQKLPADLKTRGKPRVAKWELVDKTLNNVSKSLGGLTCEYSFGQLFRTKHEELYFPLTNSLVRLVPDESLAGIEVFNEELERIGLFEGKVRFEKSGNLYARSSYTIYYFQFRTESGKLESVPRQMNLLDRYLVRWADIRDKVALRTVKTELDKP
jgi:hypothetical protein